MNKEFHDLEKVLINSISSYYLWKKFYYFNAINIYGKELADKNAFLISQIGSFWHTTQLALEQNFIINILKFFDANSRANSLDKLVKKNKELLDKTRELRERYDSLLNRNNGKFKILRDQYFAHDDRNKILHKLTLNEVNLVEKLMEDIGRVMDEHFKVATVYDSIRGAIESDFEYLTIGFGYYVKKLDENMEFRNEQIERNSAQSIK